MKTKRLKTWPHWTRSNARLFVVGLAAYAGLYALLYLDHILIVFHILTIVARVGIFGVLWIVIDEIVFHILTIVVIDDKDQGEI